MQCNTFCRLSGLGQTVTLRPKLRIALERCLQLHILRHAGGRATHVYWTATNIAPAESSAPRASASSFPAGMLSSICKAADVVNLTFKHLWRKVGQRSKGFAACRLSATVLQPDPYMNDCSHPMWPEFCTGRLSTADYLSCALIVHTDEDRSVDQYNLHS